MHYGHCARNRTLSRRCAAPESSWGAGKHGLINFSIGQGPLRTSRWDLLTSTRLEMTRLQGIPVAEYHSTCTPSPFHYRTPLTYQSVPALLPDNCHLGSSQPSDIQTAILFGWLTWPADSCPSISTEKETSAPG
jgi:hypothetical protein